MSLKHEIRQSSVIQGTGPGAMTVLQQGVTVIVPGIDAWYRKASGQQEIPVDCRVDDVNLAAALHVDYFAVPPANGFSTEPQTDYLNSYIFPRWVVCSNCKSLKLLQSAAVNLETCAQCESANIKWAKNVQVNFVMACEGGHLDEFPWVKWVHKGKEANCPNPERLKLESKGTGDLRGQRISCISCPAERTLDRTNLNKERANSDKDDSKDTILSADMHGDGGPLYLCPGASPWLHEFSGSCTNQVRMIPRNANNIYYSLTADSILIPPAGAEEASLIDVLEPRLNVYKIKAAAFKYDLVRLRDWIMGDQVELFENVDAEELLRNLKILIKNPADSAAPAEGEEQRAIHNSEYLALCQEQNNRFLNIRGVGYVAGAIPKVASISAVLELRKTTALTGFARISPNFPTVAQGKELLQRNKSPNTLKWLPAVQHVGEGIFFRLDEASVAKWENNVNLQNRVKVIEKNLLNSGRATADNLPTPRSVLLHTLAHVLIQEFVIECGYTAAALAERIYSKPGQAGILIYTASADADGTMGGLVEMAQPHTFERILNSAIEKARWCSNDPVCMELGKEGQGIHGTNLSACHSCCLLPETACQNFNQALDRATLIGDLAEVRSVIGFFDS